MSQQQQHEACVHVEGCKELADKFQVQPKTAALIRETVRRELRAAGVTPGRKQNDGDGPRLSPLPTTGRPLVDRAVAELGPDAQAALAILLRHHGQSQLVDRVRDLLEAYVERYQDPDRLRRTCMAANDADAEDRALFWLGLTEGTDIGSIDE